MARALIHWFALGLGLLACAVAGCSKDDNGASGTPAVADLPEKTAIMGRVLDVDGRGIEGVTVSGGGAETTSGDKGAFELEAAAGSDVAVTLVKEGYLRGIKRVDVLDGTPTALEVVLVEEVAAVELDADAGGTVEGERGAALVASPGAFVDQDGNPVSGTVDVHLTPLDPAIDEQLAAYPGDLRARAEGGAAVQLETYGVLDVTVRQDGDLLHIADGESVEIRIPAPSAGAESPPDTVGLWSFDEESAVWVEEGTLSYNAEEHTFDGSISHLSPWNADMPLDTTCIRGIVVDSDGARVPGALVLAQGVDFLGAASATADENGEFCVLVRKGSLVEVTAIHPLGGGTTREVTSGDADTPIPADCGACEDVGTWTLEKGTLTDAQGEQVDCSTIDVPYVGTCAEDMFEMFLCFNPEGACTYDLGAGAITYGNGARLLTSGMQTQAYGADGELCYTTETSVGGLSAAIVTYTDGSSGDAWVMQVNQQGDQTIECPNGETVALTSQQMEALTACTGAGTTTGGASSGSAGEECTIVGTGVEGMPTQCTSAGDCAAGEICCAAFGFCMADAEGIESICSGTTG